ncbi:MAG: Spore cortex peptidoglycan biosynthesis regulator SpoVE [Candidatus Jorgensenbacteria bacterium GW2011_GWB1_49_9]|nr:MAG: Spore cortex peptidoglycan biosynthesis regulator SpoVE [Candidatus Jorgensenbacteria bacterium GW2011_GWB1_49_9]
MTGRFGKGPDYVFLGVLMILLIFGLVMLASASGDLAKAQFGDSYYYLRHQILTGLLLGLVGFLVGYIVNYRHWEKLAIWFLAASILILLLVFTPLGVKLYGSERWLDFNGISFQPGELVKLTFLIYLASWLSRKSQRSKSWSEGFLPFLFVFGLVAVLLILQPSTSTAVILGAASFVTYFTAGGRIKFLAAGGILFLIALILLIAVTPYRLQRVLSFLNPQTNQLGASYHINQALIAIGSGGLTGVGYGQSTTKLHYLPEPLSDSIFAVIGEELGFLGALFVILIFLAFIWRGLKIAKRAPDDFGRFMAAGFTALIGVQAFVNIGAISGLIPLTGVPLPFVSYGGTALAVFLTMGGIILNISRQRR